MNTDFQNILKQLGKQAQKEAAEKQAAEKTSKNKNRISIFHKQSDNSPIKKPTAILCAARQNPHQSPSQRQPRRRRKLLLHRQHIQRPARQLQQKRTGKKRHPTPENGYYPVVTDVDLHGYTQEEAQKVLNEFIAFTQKRGVCGEIIHGSGLGSKGYKPVLKNMTRNWLMQHPDVLAYAEPREVQRRLRPHPAQTQIKAARLTNFSDRLGSTAQYPYNLQTIFGGDLGFDGVAKQMRAYRGLRFP